MGFCFKRRHFRKGKEVLQGRTWWIQYSRAGKKIRESSGSTKLAPAKRLLKLREGMIAQGAPITQKTNSATMNELYADVELDWKCNGRRTLKHLKRRWRKHLQPFFHKKKAALICTSDMRRFAVLRLEGGAAPAEVNRELAIVRRMLNLGVQNGKMLNRVFVPMLKESSPRSGFFEHEQYLAVCNQLAEPLRPLITVAYVTGWRVNSELLPLQWRNVDFGAGRITLDPGTTKNDAARTFPLTQDLRAILENQKLKTEELQRKRGIVIPWVFHRNGRQIRAFRIAWCDACKRAGVAGRIPHDLRRTAVRNLVRAGIPERVAMQMTGHKTRSVFERYNIVSEGDLTMAAQKLDEASQKALQTATNIPKVG
jgi:integrase